MAENIENKMDYTGKLLIAMPHMTDPRFAKSVIYICIHNDQGAMGLMINRMIEGLDFKDLVEQLKIEFKDESDKEVPIFFGGPVDANRGFVLHSTDFLNEHSLKITSDIALSATLEMIDKIIKGEGPKKYLIALGYSGWGQGQLDKEVENNGWLVSDPDFETLFDPQVSQKWRHSIERMGINLTMLSSDIGHA